MAKPTEDLYKPIGFSVTAVKLVAYQQDDGLHMGVSKADPSHVLDKWPEVIDVNGVELFHQSTWFDKNNNRQVAMYE